MSFKFLKINADKNEGLLYERGKGGEMRVLDTSTSHLANRILNNNLNSAYKVTRKLALGYRITAASDDAAGLCIAEKLKARVIGLLMARRNALDGISLTQVAEGAMQEVAELIHRTRALVTQAANSSYTNEDRRNIQQVINQYAEHVKLLAEQTEFNTKKILYDPDSNDNPSRGKTLTFHVGGEAFQTLDITMTALNTLYEKYLSKIDVTTREKAEEAFKILDEGLSNFLEGRTRVGADMTRLERTIKTIDAQHISTQKTESLIREADIAREKMDLIRREILIRSGSRMFNITNVLPENAFAVLRRVM